MRKNKREMMMQLLGKANSSLEDYLAEQMLV
jgi:hypothetical protein